MVERKCNFLPLQPKLNSVFSQNYIFSLFSQKIGVENVLQPNPW